MKKSTGPVALLAKIGPKIFSIAAKLAKTIKFTKIGLAALSFSTYAWLFSWQFSLIILGMLFVHESGHVWAMKRYGIKTRGFYFLPIIGGAAVAESDFPSRKAETVIAIMGPIWGLALSIVVAGVYFYTQHPLFAAAAGWMAMVNLFNLLPINPLDGGRIFKSIAFSINTKLGLVFLIVGIVGTFLIAFYFSFTIYMILLLVGSLELIFEYKRQVPHPAMNTTEILWSFALYAVVACALWTVMAQTQHVPGADLAMEMMTH